MIGAKWVWGIDIGASSVKGVKLLVQGQGFTVEDFDVLQHRGDPEPADGPIPDRRAWRTLALFQEKHRIRSEHLVVSVPGQCIFTRPLQVIEVPGKPLNELVRYEVRQLLGIDLDAVMWDYELFPNADGDDRNRQGVLFAIKRVDYNPFVRSLNAARIGVDDIQTLPLALYNYVRHSLAPDRPTLALDIGANSLTLLAIYDDRYWTRTVPAGGRLITEALQQSFQCDFAQAESIKVNAAQSKHAREILQRMLPAMRGVLGEVQNALTLLRSDVPGVPFQQAVAVGGASRTLGLTRLLSKELRLTVLTPDPLQNFPLANDVDRGAAREAAPALAAACGLALQGAEKAATKVSLVAAGTVRGKHLARTRPFAIASLAVAALMVALSIVFGQIELKQLREHNEGLSARMAPVENLRHRFETATRQTPAEKRLENFKNLGLRRDAFLACLGKVAHMFALASPQRPMWIRRVSMRLPRRDHPDERYTRAGELQVSLHGATERRRNEAESTVRESVRMNVANYLYGLDEVVADPRPEVLTTASAQLDSLAPVPDDTWRYMFFSVDFLFKTDVSAGEENER